MAVLQALFALISKSAGKILNAIFGWAVHALFGQTSSTQQTLLSALVAAAVAWPLLLVGVVAPKTAALVLAFVPLPHWIPSWVVRIVWVVLALTVPIAVGLTIMAKAPVSDPPESRFKKFFRGFPITLGLAAAFLIMFFSVPIMRLVAMLRGWKSADVPFATDTRVYHQVASGSAETLNQHGFGLRKSNPGFWVRAPTRILGWFGGDAFRRFVPRELEHYGSPDFEMSFYTSGVLLRGVARKLTWAQGLIAEDAARRDVFLTVDSAAQQLETQIHRVWHVFEQEPKAHRGSARLLGRIDDITKELANLSVPYEEWQVIYRQVLQLDRAVRGESQLLESVHSKALSKEDLVGTETENKMALAATRPAVKEAALGRTAEPAAPARPAATKSAAELSNSELIREITSQVGLLAKKQIDLATTELKADIKSEVAMVGGLGVAALAGIITLNLLFVTAILALAQVMPAWGAGLAVSGFTLAIAGVAGMVGWNKRVRSPLFRTRRALKEDAQWTKERLA